jgi:hypothetical protein
MIRVLLALLAIIAGVLAALVGHRGAHTSPAPAVARGASGSMRPPTERAGRPDQRGLQAKRTLAPPVFVAKSASPVQNDPLAPDYDPVKLGLATHAFRQLFDAEPRNPVWAPKMEEQALRLAHQILDHLEYLDMKGIECHTSTCVLTFSYPEDKDREVGFLSQNMGLAPVTTSYGSEHTGGIVTESLELLYPAELKDPASLQQSGQAQREKTLKWLKQEGAKHGVRPPPQ